MPASKPATKTATEQAKSKRRYNSPLREQRSRQTRERIVCAGSELVHEFHAWDWTNLTAAAVGERAGVSERTVQRYFPTERQLRDAVIERLVEESGVDLEGMALGEFHHVIELMYSHLSSFSIKPEKVEDPTFASIDQYRRDMLMAAATRAMPDNDEADTRALAAAMDVFWNPMLYERLVEAWQLPPERAVQTITWLVRLVSEAAHSGDHP